MNRARIATLVSLGWFTTLAFPVALRAQASTAHAALAHAIDSIAQRAIAEGPIAGLSVAVVWRGDTIVAKGYGLANVEHAAPVTPSTVFHVNSVTKMFTAATILRLVDRHQLTLDDDILRFFPTFQARGRRITVRELLNHTSGIRDYTTLPGWAERERIELPPEVILALFSREPFDFEPGTSWRYDNSGFFLLGLIIEKVTGKPYAQAIDDEISRPLGLANTHICADAAIVPHRAQPYTVAHGALANAPPIAWRTAFSGGSLCSTSTDLVAWMSALDGGRVVSPGSLAAMRAPTQLHGAPPIDYGLGTDLGALAGHRMYGHSGSGGGYYAVLDRFPDDDLTVVVLSNTGSPPTARIIGARIARAVLSEPEAIPAASTEPDAKLAPYVGTWSTEDGDVQISIENGTLVGRVVGKNAAALPLHRLSGDTFRIAEDYIVRFVVEKGRATWAMMYEGGLFEDAAPRIR